MRREYQSATVLTGRDVMHLTRKKRKEIALQVSTALKQHPNRMRQLKVGEVFRSIMDENAVVVFKRGTGKVVAFSHVIPAKNEFGEVESDAVEVGALVTLAEPGNGHAKRAVVEGIRTGKRKGAKKVKTLVHVDNAAANGVMTSLAGEPYHSRQSNYVREPDGTRAQMNVYDITNAGGSNL